MTVTSPLHQINCALIGAPPFTSRRFHVLVPSFRKRTSVAFDNNALQDWLEVLQLVDLRVLSSNVSPAKQLQSELKAKCSFLSNNLAAVSALSRQSNPSLECAHF